MGIFMQNHIGIFGIINTTGSETECRIATISNKYRIIGTKLRMSIHMNRQIH